MPEGNNRKYDLLKLSPVKKLFLSKWFPYGFQFVFLILFIALAVAGWQVFPQPGMNDKLFAKTNIVTNTIWAIWWPSMIWIAVLFGRAWCMVCPLELVANFSERLGRKLGIKQRPISKWIRNGALIVALYAFIQLLVSGVHIHRIPAYTSFFLIGLLFLSLFVSLFFIDRAFCRGFCPVGLLLNAYGRGGMLAIRSENNNCKFCVVKDCVIDSNRRKIDSRSCPSLLNPERLSDNADCLLCGQCLKSCGPENLKLELRTPYHSSDKRTAESNWMLTIFVILVSGFVTYEFTTEWGAAKKIFLLAPESFTAYTGLSGFGGIIKGLWTIMIFPLMLWTVLGFLTVLTKGAKNITEAWRNLALPLVIIVAAGHMTKSVAKFISWVVYSPWTSNDPTGYSRVKDFSAGLIELPNALAGSGFVAVTGFVILTLAFIYSLREERLINPESSGKKFLSKLVLFCFYLFLVAGIGLK